MGYFSWLTADCRTSISCNPKRKTQTVYLLQPGGKPPIAEADYAGYGEFGGIDAFEWLAEVNCGIRSRQLGIGLEANLYRAPDGSLFACALHLTPEDKQAAFPDTDIYLFGNYAEVIPAFGATPNALIYAGIWKPSVVAETLLTNFLPLKFSFYPAAIYEDLPASDSCPVQGYFYDDADLSWLR